MTLCCVWMCYAVIKIVTNPANQAAVKQIIESVQPTPKPQVVKVEMIPSKTRAEMDREIQEYFDQLDKNEHARIRIPITSEDIKKAEQAVPLRPVPEPSTPKEYQESLKKFGPPKEAPSSEAALAKKYLDSLGVGPGKGCLLSPAQVKQLRDEVKAAETASQKAKLTCCKCESVCTCQKCACAHPQHTDLLPPKP